MYRYDDSCYLSEALIIGLGEELVQVRTTWIYDEDGTLLRAERDGRIEEGTRRPDGVADSVTMYTLLADKWESSSRFELSGATQTISVSFDLPGLTFGVVDPTGVEVRYAHETPASSPNDFVALPTISRVIGLGVRTGMSSDGTSTVFAWDGGRVLSETASTAITSIEGVFNYVCP